jgi:hypothetical protein
VDGSLLSLDDYKALINDLTSELTDSLSRSGKGGLTAPLKTVDGTVSLPGVAFNSEASSGLSRYGPGDLRLSVLANLIARFIATGVEVTGTVKATGGLADDTTHGVRGGGTQHAEVTQTVDGFMSAADKAKLDSAGQTAVANSLVRRDGAGRTQFADPAAAADAATKNYVDGAVAGVSSGYVSNATFVSAENGARSSGSFGSNGSITTAITNQKVTVVASSPATTSGSSTMIVTINGAQVVSATVTNSAPVTAMGVYTVATPGTYTVALTGGGSGATFVVW